MALSKNHELGSLANGLDVNQTSGSVISVNLNSDVVSEGSSNQYFTNERVDDRVSSLLVAGSNITLTYNDASNTLTIASTDTEDNLSNNTTSDLAEGTNLYFTNARVDARITASDTDALSEGSSNLYYTDARVDAYINASILTTDVSEGTNLYYTDARVDAYINASILTTDVSEGTNLYYTDARADARITASDTDALSEGSSNLYYTDVRADARIAAADTGDLSEGSNLYYTDARVQTYIGGNRTYGDITTTGSIKGPATLTIDPAAVGDNTGTVVIAGNLTINGTQTTVNSNTVNIGDNILVLNSDEAGTPSQNAGIEIERGTSTNVTFVWDETNDMWTTSAQTLKTGHMLPETDITYDLGSTALKWRDLYLSGSTIKLGGATLSASGANLSMGSGSFDLSNSTTANLPEHTDYKYYTDARAQAASRLAIIGGTGITNSSGTINLDNTAVTAASYGSATAIPVIVIDAQGRITSASTSSISTDLVADTTPQLGGDLDLNGNNITGTGNINITGTVDGRDLSVDGTKLDGIEASATADQTAAQLLTAIKTVDGTGSGLDADLLDGNQASAFATSAQGTLATNALPLAGGTLTGALFANSGIGIGTTTITDPNWGSGNKEFTIDGTTRYSIIHLRGTGAGSTDTRFSQGVGDSKFYMAYDDVAGVHRITVESNGTVTIPGNISVAGTVDGRDVATDGTKLDGIASGANNFSMPSALVPASIDFNGAGPTLTEERDQNMKIQGHSGTDIGISGYDSSNNWRFQLYGASGAYGFLDGNWAGWDIRKVTNSHLYLNNDTTYYLNPASTSNINGLTVAGQTTLNGNIQVSAGDTLIVGGTLANNAYNSNNESTIFLGGGNDRVNYSIGTLMENTGGNYTKLDIRWHTGIRMFAMPQYGGLRYYTDNPMSTQIFSIGQGDSHVRVTNNLYAGYLMVNSGAGDIRSPSNTWSGEVPGKMQYHSSSWYLQYSTQINHRNSAGLNTMSLDASGNVTFAANVTAYSDIRFKENIKTIKNAVDLVGQMRGVFYNEKKTKNARVGVIAQELEKVLPEVVRDNEQYNPDTGKTEESIKSVDYGNIVGVLIEAIKEQQKQIDELKAEVEELKNGSTN